MNVPTAPPEGAKYLLPCPLCGREDAALDYLLAWKTNTVEPFIHCFSAGCQALGGLYIEEVGVALGCEPGASKETVAVAWVREAGPAGSLRPGGTGPLEEQLPSDRTITGWQMHLRAAPPALRYLHDERGLTDATIEQARIGLGLRAEVQVFALPVYDVDGQLVNVRYRPWPHPLPLADGTTTKILGPRGHPAALYPGWPPGRAVLLCEGEFDALLARQHGLPAVTSTAGTSWDPAWNHLLAGRRVAVCYDAGDSSLTLARVRARKFAAGPKGSQAWAVDLRTAGLANGEDLTDWFLQYGLSAGDLKRLVRQARKDGNT